MIKYLLTCFTIILYSAISAQDSTIINDGPYVFKQGHKYEELKVISGNAKKNILGSGARLEVVPTECNNTFVAHLNKTMVTQAAEYPAADKMIIISDIEGEFCPFIDLMRACKVIDENNKWAFGINKLIICGDLFDRGREVTAYLWFLYELEQQAKKAGGKVHVILGNHDIMNLSGDLRYVDKKYFTAARLINKPYMELYTKNTVLGDWLRSKNIIEKIGDRLFLHGGISPDINKENWTLSQINDSCRKYYDQPAKTIPAPIKQYFTANGLLWYRSYFIEPLLEEAGLDSALKKFNVKGIVVGHTIRDRITGYYNNKVIGVDVDHHDGHHEALLIEGNEMFTIDISGKKQQLQSEEKDTARRDN